jgi:hypothetical protein
VSGILVVAVLFAVVVVAVDARRSEEHAGDLGIQQYLSLDNVDFGNPLDRAVFRESLRIFYPGQGTRNDSLMQAIEDLRQRQFTDPRYKSGSNLQGLTWELLGSLSGMYLQFVAVYVVVLILIYLGAQRIGIYRFVKMKQHRESYLEQALRLLWEFRPKKRGAGGWKEFAAEAKLLGEAVAKGCILVILFSPAYVIAYSLKTTFDTSSLLFMVLLGIVSNGVLIYAANRFFTFLVTESHKGYVQTAVVKNLRSSYEWDAADGIPLRSLVRIRGAFRSHVLSHIFLNARFQFIPALKEHASFLITGLIIIEMALNIQGHLCYELLQQILYRQYDVACAIIFSIFLTVKATEIAVDIWAEREKRRYGY